jgi:hypothetical protein
VKRFLLCIVCLLAALVVTSLAAMDLLIAPIAASSDNLAPTPLLLMGLLLIGASMLRRIH